MIISLVYLKHMAVLFDNIMKVSFKLKVDLINYKIKVFLQVELKQLCSSVNCEKINKVSTERKLCGSIGGSLCTFTFQTIPTSPSQR